MDWSSGKGYYEQKWQILGSDGVIREMWHPFVQKEDGEYWTWASFVLPSGEMTVGKYRNPCISEMESVSRTGSLQLWMTE